MTITSRSCHKIWSWDHHEITMGSPWRDGQGEDPGRDAAIKMPKDPHIFRVSYGLSPAKKTRNRYKSTGIVMSCFTLFLLAIGMSMDDMGLYLFGGWCFICPTKEWACVSLPPYLSLSLPFSSLSLSLLSLLSPSLSLPPSSPSPLFSLSSLSLLSLLSLSLFSLFSLSVSLYPSISLSLLSVSLSLSLSLSLPSLPPSLPPSLSLSLFLPLSNMYNIHTYLFTIQVAFLMEHSYPQNDAATFWRHIEPRQVWMPYRLHHHGGVEPHWFWCEWSSHGGFLQ